jgi:type I restriction-modification system DNA methylase subunit
MKSLHRSKNPGGIFWVPQEARWSKLRANAKQPNIGVLLDEAMTAIERDNERLKGVLPKEYARPALDKERLGRLIVFTLCTVAGRRGWSRVWPILLIWGVPLALGTASVALYLSMER